MAEVVFCSLAVLYLVALLPIVKLLRPNHEVKVDAEIIGLLAVTLFLQMTMGTPLLLLTTAVCVMIVYFVTIWIFPSAAAFIELLPSKSFQINHLLIIDFVVSMLIIGYHFVRMQLEVADKELP